MSEPASITSGIAARYATAVLDLAHEEDARDAVEGDLGALEGAIVESRDFRSLISSPIYARDDTLRAIAALAERMELSGIMTRTLGLMASKRRLFVLPALLRTLRARIAEEKGEVTARVTAARRLSDAQRTRLSDTLAKTAGKTVKISAAVDEGLIGGLVVQLGSRMIDTSIRAQLGAMQNRMKEVG